MTANPRTPRKAAQYIAVGASVATLAIMADPDEGFDGAIAEAERVVALRGAPTL